MNVKLFVEGVADKKFLSDYIKVVFGISIPKENLIETQGWSIINSEEKSELIVNEMIKNIDNDGVNLLIFDADEKFIDRVREIEEWKERNNLEFEFFLWPNNGDSGDLETVLENIIQPVNQPIFDCWEKYENCLKDQQIQGRDNPLTIPAKKTKIYAYLEVLLGESKSQKKQIKEAERNYRKIEHWDLNAQYIVPLKEFLSPYFTNED